MGRNCSIQTYLWPYVRDLCLDMCCGSHMAVRRRNCVPGASVHVDDTSLVRRRDRSFPRLHNPFSAAPRWETQLEKDVRG